MMGMSHTLRHIRSRVSAVVLVGAALVAAGGLSAPAHAETLADALSLAYQTNPTLQAERARVRALDETFVQARSGRGPQVSVEAGVSGVDALSRRDLAGFGIAGTNVNSDTEATASYGVSASQSLYQGGRVRAQMDAASAAIDAGRATLYSVEQSVLVDVVRAYVNVRRDERVIDIRRNNMEVLSRQLQAAQDRFEVGEITRTDVAQAQARLAGATSLLQAARAELSTSRAVYERVVGQAPGALQPEPPLPPLPATIEDAVDTAVSRNPQVQAARFAEEAARADIRAARANRRPQVGVGLGAQRQDGLLTGGSDLDTASVSGTVTIPLFTSGLNSSRVRQAREAASQARLQMHVAERAVRESVAAAYAGFLAANAQITSFEEQVRATELAFEGVEEEARVGLRTTLDVLDAEQELLNARLSLTDARRDAYVAGFGLLQAIGGVSPEALGLTGTFYNPADNFDAVARRGVRLPFGD